MQKAYVESIPDMPARETVLNKESQHNSVRKPYAISYDSSDHEDREGKKLKEVLAYSELPSHINSNGNNNLINAKQFSGKRIVEAGEQSKNDTLMRTNGNTEGATNLQSIDTVNDVHAITSVSDIRGGYSHLESAQARDTARNNNNISSNSNVAFAYRGGKQSNSRGKRRHENALRKSAAR